MTCPENDYVPENFSWPSDTPTNTMITAPMDYIDTIGRWGDLTYVDWNGTIFLYVTILRTEEGIGTRCAMK